MSFHVRTYESFPKVACHTTVKFNKFMIESCTHEFLWFFVYLVGFHNSESPEWKNKFFPYDEWEESKTSGDEMWNPDGNKNLWLWQPLLHLIRHHRVQGVQEVVEIRGVVIGDVEYVTAGRVAALQFVQSLEG